MARSLAERGEIGVRYGCHCVHIIIKRLLCPTPWVEQLQFVLLRLFSRIVLPGVVRVSFGLQTSKADLDWFVEMLDATSRRPRTQRIGGRINAFVRAATAQVYAPTGG